MSKGFLTDFEIKISQEFQSKGYLIFDVNDLSLLNKVKNRIFQIGKKQLNLKNLGRDEFFNHTERYLKGDLNDFRLTIHKEMNRWQNLRSALYLQARNEINTIIGNELAMQRLVNLSIQMPNDSGSLLPIHTDVWSGNSPFEAVLWLPLVNCSKSKSMFVIPQKKSLYLIKKFSQIKNLTLKKIESLARPHYIELEVPFGKAVLFSHSILHGNSINKEDQTRWSLNVRFKSLLSPYGSKNLGESFNPIIIRPMTSHGYDYVEYNLGR